MHTQVGLGGREQEREERGRIGARHGDRGVVGAVYGGKSGGRRGAAGGPAPRVDSRYTAATSVSAMSARSDFYNAPCTLPHSRSLTPSHPPPQRGAEDLRERRASASVSRGDLRASERASERASRESARGFLLVRWNLFEDFSEKFVNPRRRYRGRSDGQ